MNKLVILRYRIQKSLSEADNSETVNLSHEMENWGPLMEPGQDGMAWSLDDGSKSESNPSTSMQKCPP